MPLKFKGGKIIKKFFKILLWTLGVIILIPILAYFLFLSKTIQTYVSQEVATYLSQRTHTEIKIQGVDISPFKSIILKGLYAEDFQKDTLVYIKKLNIKIDSFNLDKHHIYVNKLTLNKTYFKLYQGKEGKQNIDVFIDALVKQDSTITADTIQKPWSIKVKNIDIKDSFFGYKTSDYIPQHFGMNYDDIYVSKLNLQARDIQLVGDSIWFDVKHLSCLEKSGFEIKKLQSQMWITNSQWGISNLQIRTSHSKLKAKYLHFNYIPNQGYWSDFVNKMRLNFRINSSEISFLDIAYFNEVLLGFRELVAIKGHFYGTINELRAKQLNINYGDHTSIKGQFYLNGLPDIKTTYLNAKFQKLTTSITDMQRIYIPGYKNGHFKIPSFLNNLGVISYKGRFNGFFNDFVCFGNFKTDLGDFKTDILLNPEETSDKIKFNGDLETTNFNLGGLLQQKKVGNVTMNVEVNGYASTSNTEGTIKGNVHALEFYDYNYENVALNGFFGNSIFDGKLSVEDPNINFNFSGKVDFSKQIPTINFNSNLLMAKLHPLKLNKSDKNSHLTFSMTANLKGSDFNNINGILNINNAEYKNSLGKLPLKQLTLEAATTPDAKKVSVNSDYANMYITGNYSANKLKETVLNLIYNYLPAYAKDTVYMQHDSINKFNFAVQLKNTSQISKVLYPDITLAENTLLKGDVDAPNRNYNIQFETDLFKYHNNQFYKLKINVDADKKQLTVKSKVHKYGVFDDYGLYNLSPKITFKNNNVNFNLYWNNWGETTYSGAFLASGELTKSANKKNNKWNIHIKPSTIVIADSVWQIPQAKIKIDSSNWHIDNFRIQRNNDFLSINGKLSENKTDSIKVKFRNIALKKFNAILSAQNTDIKGTINGDIKLLDFYDTPIINSDIQLSNFILNKDTIGDITLYSAWDKISKKVKINGQIANALAQKMDINGYFFPEENSLDAQVHLNQMGINFMHAYLKEYVSDLSGSLSGNLNLKGDITTLRPEGNIKLNDVKLKVNATQVKYQCNDSVTLSAEKIHFKQFKVNDIKNSTAIVNGDINYHDFSAIGFNLTSTFNNFKILNSKITDNDIFYGTSYVSGVGKLQGDINELKADINIKTEENSSIYIPMDAESDLEEINFITFINNSTFKNNNAQQNNSTVNLFGIDVNCDLEITPETKVQIIFDSKIGDILKATGAGNLKVQIDREGEFQMYGNYTIKKGSYLFTLQNVINKKFDLAQGGIIKWNGNPYDAKIDIDASYTAKTTLYDLLLNTPYVDKTKKIPVQCKMNLSKSLENPTIKFDINFPTLDQQTQSVLGGLFSSEDEINKQILSLLVLNRFYTPEYMRATDPNFENKNSSYGVGATVGELFSNQLSNWLSQISNDFDIGFTWRPGDNITKDEVELALSTQIFNDRVTINGNVGTRNDQTAKSNFVGDVDVNVKLNKSGKLQFKAFTRSNEYLIYEENKNTQGIGIFYKEDFNTWGELFRKYLRFFKRKKKKKKQQNKR